MGRSEPGSALSPAHGTPGRGPRDAAATRGCCVFIPGAILTYHPKPSIFLRPRSGVALGGAVTVRCRGRHQDVRFLLYKVGNPNALQDAAPAGDVAEFPIRNVSRGDAGSYNCRYSTKSDPPVWSEPSDPAVLVVAGEGPGSASPGGLTLVGHSEAGFALGPAEGTNVAEFPIRDVSRRHGGKYLCYYRSKSDPPVWSHPSDPVELVVAGEGPGSASPLPAPPPAGPSEGLSTDGTLRARLSGTGPSAEFAPHQPGQLKPQEMPGRGPSSVTVSSRFPPGLGARFPPSPISADARFNPTERTDPAGPQQPDPPPTEPEGEGEQEKWNNSSPREQGSPLRRPRGHSGRLEGDGPCRQN
uniref:Ig-like domain-containing protein n=1 Tax=Chelydra serpentina TaxID=8475 RepID=A0A8C3XS01_CHESE